MKIDKSVHAPGTILLLELRGEIHEAVIALWSPLGNAVKIFAGQTQMWLATPKVHAVEFLRIVGWDEFGQMVKEVEAEKKAKEANQAEEVEGEKS